MQKLAFYRVFVAVYIGNTIFLNIDVVGKQASVARGARRYGSGTCGADDMLPAARFTAIDVELG